MIAVGEKKNDRSKILEGITEKRIIQQTLDEAIREEEKILKKLEKDAFKIKLLPCTFYLPAYDIVIWKGEKYKYYNMDLSKYYGERLALGNNIVQITEDVRGRIQLLLTENKGLEDWAVLGVLLIRTYDSQNED
ncbi:hypothetical protein IKD57_02220 [Candidatus Saccharibacteria bacterium]|nr:hypothetical protein [Candidatus Saccharibacteria bacterium]